MFDTFRKIFRKKKKFVCPGAFSQAYITADGKVWFCPDCYFRKDGFIGNINEQDFTKIYNSEKAIKLRKEILKGQYNYCSPIACSAKAGFHIWNLPLKEKIEYKAVQKNYPAMMCINPDWECNLHCIMCRPEVQRLSDDLVETRKKYVDEKLLPICKNLKILTLNSEADPFASRVSRYFLKRAAQEYPHLKFNIYTNGILFDKYNCDEIGITDRLNNAIISIHASNEQIYNEIVKHGNYNKLMENFEWAVNMRNEKKINDLFAAFVVSSKNYFDIPNFIEIAERYRIKALFWGCGDFGVYKYESPEDALTISNPNHPNFNKFISVLKNINMDSKYTYFSYGLKQIKKIYCK